MFAVHVAVRYACYFYVAASYVMSFFCCALRVGCKAYVRGDVFGVTAFRGGGRGVLWLVRFLTRPRRSC